MPAKKPAASSGSEVAEVETTHLAGCCFFRGRDVDSSEESSSAEEEVECAVPGDVRFAAGHFCNAQGLFLRTYTFVKAGVRPRGVILLCHGYACHTFFEWLRPSAPGEPHDTWEGSVLKGLVDAGYFVCAVDQQGHGRSESVKGVRCFFNSFDHLAQECIDYLKDVLKRDALKGLPVFVLGESMGGATAVRIAHLAPELFRGVVFYAPMLSLEEVKKKRVIGPITNGSLASVAKLLDAVIPTVGIAAPGRNTLHPLSQKEFDEDPLCYHGQVRTRVAREFQNITNTFMVEGSLAEMSVPFITFHSQKDTFTDPLGSEVLHRTARSTDKTYVKVGKGHDLDLDMWHALGGEPGCEVVLAKALEWIQARS